MDHRQGDNDYLNYRSRHTGNNSDDDANTSGDRVDVRHSARCRLMELPAELRCIVLKELLVSSEPLWLASATAMKYLASRGYIDVKHYFEVRPARKVFPEILVACRQIHTEASELLYTNTIEMHMVSQLYAGPHLPRPSEFLATLPRQISRLQVSLLASSYDTMPSMWTNGCMELCRALIDRPNLTELTFVMTGWFTSKQVKPVISAPDKALGLVGSVYARRIPPLQHMLYLRGRTVTCEGIEPDLAHALCDTLTLPSPDLDLPSRLHALEKVGSEAAKYRAGDRSIRNWPTFYYLHDKMRQYVWVMDTDRFFSAEAFLMESVGKFWAEVAERRPNRGLICNINPRFESYKRKYLPSASNSSANVSNASA
ncbi:uncharacterized protein AB675_10445 [Cyphellophora attinorum]|uniref:F-box domain-containing protein n=1 Tax=Cyphellophora attinorum TaxID=1664694 RepID=A0A0N1GYK3_9EURO|nr:uncharacterized protein AB675_10445 [Phialophora attinorum]KPI35877.1 hypothetical protein AB675_10445 [Phialophora attinorum]